MKTVVPARNAPNGRTIASQSPAETTRVGERIGRALRAGDLLLLRGDLGAGKTQFACGVAAGLGIAGPIPSPTFTLVNEYAGCNAAGATVPLAHIDLYRLGDGGDLDSLGLDDYLGGAWAAVIEWPERAVDDGFVPPSYLDIAIADAGDQARTLSFTAYGDATRLLHTLGSDA
ncbi:MAG: tRNA (adenosine(37)-N6)-threonylcarbamoyltransferase complex ATPase subunit type 1 TsaE [Thermomicrobiales bacterium]